MHCFYFNIAFFQYKKEYKSWNPALDTLKVLEGQDWPEEVKNYYDSLPARAEQTVRKEVWEAALVLRQILFWRWRLSLAGISSLTFQQCFSYFFPQATLSLQYAFILLYAIILFVFYGYICTD